MATKRILLVIPYLVKGAQGGELETAVRGWKKNFRGELHILIIGDSSPVVNKLMADPRVELLPLPRRAENAKEPMLDVACKMLAVISKYSTTYTGCIWSNDDIYPVNLVTISDIKKLKTVGDELDGNAGSANYFKRGMFRTKEALLKEGCPIHNYCNHLPDWYSFDRLSELLEKFDCTHTPHLINSLYFNYWYRNEKTRRVNVGREDNHFKLGVYSTDFNLDVLRERIKKGVLFINHSSAGYRPELIHTIREFL